MVQQPKEATESNGQSLEYLKKKKMLFFVLRRFHSNEQNIVKFS